SFVDFPRILSLSLRGALATKQSIARLGSIWIASLLAMTRTTPSVQPNGSPSHKRRHALDLDQHLRVRQRLHHAGGAGRIGRRRLDGGGWGEVFDGGHGGFPYQRLC